MFGVFNSDIYHKKSVKSQLEFLMLRTNQSLLMLFKQKKSIKEKMDFMKSEYLIN